MSNESEVKPKSIDVEKKWSWVVLAAAFFNTVVINGQFTSLTIYYVVFLNAFGESKAFTASINSAFHTAICIAGPIASWLLPRMGPRPLILYAIIMNSVSLLCCSIATSIPYLIVLFAVNGLCSTMIQTGHIAAIYSYFPRKFYLATGIMYAGVGFGTLIIGSELEWAIRYFGWRGAMIIQSGVVLQSCIGGALIFPHTKSSQDRSQKALKSKRTTIISQISIENTSNILPCTSRNEKVANQIEISNNNEESTFAKSEFRKNGPSKNSPNGFLNYMKIGKFWIQVFSLLMMFMTLMIVNSMFKNIVVSYGLEHVFWLCLIMIGVGQIFGRIAAGIIAQHLLVPPLFYSLVSCITALLCIAFIFAKSEWLIVAVTLGFGLFQGQQIVGIFLQIAWLFGNDQVAIVRGYIFLFSIISSFSGAPLAGWTVDVTNSYDISLVIAAATSFISSACGMLLYFTQKNDKTKNDNEVINACNEWTHF